MIREEESWTEDRVTAQQLIRLQRILRHCSLNVPYYRTLFREIGFSPEKLRYPEDIRQIPLLDKSTVIAHPEQFLAQNIPPSERVYHTTGGTTGHPVNLYTGRLSGWHELAYMNAQWKRVGYTPATKRAVLRGIPVKSSKHWSYDPGQRAYLFSNYHLTPEIAHSYAAVIKEKQLEFFHTYPSAAVEFGRALSETGEEAPKFKVVLAGSETIYPGQREQIETLFGARVYSWFGHSENLIMGGECEFSRHYHLFPQYGFVEILREKDGTPAREGQLGELVGSTLHNEVMPLIRYRTQDLAVAGQKQCACGRPYKLLEHVDGRIQEMVVGRLGNRFSYTALNMHSDVFDRVKQFQIHQRKPGEAELWIVRKEGYTETDSRRIRAAFDAKMGDSIHLQLRFVDFIPLTERGKFRFIVQEAAIEIRPEEQVGQPNS